MIRIIAHAEGCPQALRVPVDQCCCGGRDITTRESVDAQQRSINWECGCVTTGLSWDASNCTGATHGCGSGVPCTQSPLDHSAYTALRESAERMIEKHRPSLEKLADMTGVRVRATSRMRISYVIDPVELYMRSCGAEAVVQSAATEIFRKLAEQFGPITGELVLTLETKEK